MTPAVRRVVLFGSSGALLPFGSRIVYAGDSITANGSTTTSTVLTMFATGFSTWAQQLSGQRCTMTASGNQGVSGNLASQLLVRYSATEAQRPAIVVLLIGTNDLATVDSATGVIGNIAQMIARNRAMHARTILLKILPRGSSGSPMTATQLGNWIAVNAWIVMQAARDVRVIDAEPVIGNLDANHSMLDGHSNSDDYLHPNALGSYKIGKLVAQAISSWVAAGDSFFPVNDDSSNLIANGFLTGTGGSVDSGKGTTATGWTSSGANAQMGGGVATYSKVARTDGFGDWQQVVLSGTYTGTTRSQYFRRVITMTGILNPGDVVELQGELEYDAGLVGVQQLQLSMIGSGVTVSLNAVTIGFAGGIPDGPIAVKMRSLPFTLPASPSPTTYTIACTSYLLNTVGTDPVAGTMRWGRIGLRKVN